jgi:hypothetical protein
VVEAYSWTLRDPLPSIPIPLGEEDDDVVLNLQEVFTQVYDRALYGYSLDYRAALEPGLSEADVAWVQQMIAAPLPSA